MMQVDATELRSLEERDRALVTPAEAQLTPSDQAFVLDLVRNAVVLGITDVQYRGLHVRISPTQAREGQKHSITGYSAGNWSAPIARAGQGGAK